MFDHIGFLVRDFSVSLPFFGACLKPLGIECAQNMPEFDAALFKAPDQRGFLFVAGKQERGAVLLEAGQHSWRGANSYRFCGAEQRSCRCLL